MDLPELDHAEYDKLLKTFFEWSGQHESELYWLKAPNPSQLLQDDWETVDLKGVSVEFLNVHKPHLYRTRRGSVRIILPLLDDVDYKMLEALWPGKNPSTLVLVENHYDDLDQDTTTYFYRYDDPADDEGDGHVKVPAYDKADWRTH